ncbi:MAG: GSU2204 family CXXCH-containing (seleno)protein, partial [Candidatus Zixiibacteriota bacterium]
LDRKHNIKFTAIHKTTTKSGTEQKISSNHCFSCHLTSQSADVDQVIHQIVAGLQGDIGKQTVGYEFGYRSFKSDAFEPMAWYDPAVHPVFGTSGAEFGTRVSIDNASAAFSAYPKTEKVSHKIRANGKAFKGKYTGSIGYSRVENDVSDIKSSAITGAVAYSTILSPRARLVARFSVAQLKTDDYDVDLPTFRDGRPGVQIDFDYTRYSALNRLDGKSSVELTYRYKPNITLAALVGYNIVNRDDYPIYDDGQKSNTFIGQIKAKYNKGMRYATRIKYRIEMTSDPFMSGRGLFEMNGRDSLEQLAPGFGFIFYHQREELRYQNITTLPTMAHIFEWNSTWKPNNEIDINIGLKGSIDENSDLDSLDVKHSSLIPNLALNFRPQSNLSFVLGGTYNMYKSRGPVSVALFDG